MPRRILRLTFPGSQGGRLAARLDLPGGEPAAYALFAHCFTCSKDLKAAAWVSRTLAEGGIGVLRFDFTGIGESEGDFAESSFTSNLQDLVGAADFLRAEHRAPRILIGHSLGGAAVLAAADRIPEAVAVATLGAPSDTAHLRHLLLSRAPELAAGEGEVAVSLGGRQFPISRRLLDDLAEDHVQERLGRLKRALLILHSPVDEVVGIDHARRLFEGAKHPKSFVSLDDADHLLSRERDARYAAQVLAAWAGRYVEGLGEEGAAPAAAAGEHGLVTVEGGPSGYAQEIVASGHPMKADEPASLGGTDTGPNPYDLLLAALGACTSMTLRMYADRKGWPLEGVRVELRHRKIHAQDCADCETKTGKVDSIEREIAVEGQLDDEQRARLLEIADRCPVHRTLTSEIKIESRLV